MKQFLQDLKTALNETKRFSEAEITDILADHEEMINEAISSGLAEADIESKFGSPAKVARDLSEGCGHEHAREPRQERTRDRDGEAERVAFTGVPPAGKIDILVRLTSEDVSVAAEGRTDVVVYYKGNIPLDQYEIGFTGNQFTLKRTGRDIVSWFHRGSMTFDVRVPATMTVGEIVQQNASGDYRYNAVNAESLRINSASGDGEISESSIGAVDVGSVNGDLRLTRLILGSLSIAQVSGDQMLSHIVCEGKIQIASTSGDVDVSDSTCTEAVFHTVSGDLEGREFYPESIELHGVSGDISIENEDKSRPIKIKSSKSVSGSIRIR